MKLSEVVNLFYVSMTTVRSQATIEWYRKKLNTLISFLEDPEISEITEWDLERFRASLDRPSHAIGRNGKVSVYTVHGYVRAIKRFFGYSRFRRLIKEDPSEFLEKPRLPKQPRKGISEADASLMLELAEIDSRRDFAMLMFLRDTGCRAGGVYNLLTADLDIDHNVAIVREKGDKIRSVFFTSETALALARYKFWRKNPHDLPQFFLSEDKHYKALQYRGVYEVFRRLARKANVKGKFSPHEWRHAAIRSWLKAGMNLKTASELAGHSGEQVTGDIYGTLDELELHALYDQTMARIHK